MENTIKKWERQLKELDKKREILIKKIEYAKSEEKKIHLSNFNSKISRALKFNPKTNGNIK